MFDRSLYVRFDTDWLCFGDVSIGNGPLNAFLHGSFADWRDRVAIADPVEVAGPGVVGTGAWRIRVRDAEVWRASAIGPIEPQRIRRNLEDLPRRLPAGIPDEGLACFIRHPALPRSAVAKSAAESIEAVSRWVAARGDEDARGLREALGWLIGLGPGLTPSGDDFLAGALAALHVLGHRRQARALWQQIDPLAQARTNQISISHLRAAARGGCSEALHGMLRTLAGDGDWLELDCWPDLGHSSPWDALAGVATVLRASVSTLEGSDRLHGD